MRRILFLLFISLVYADENCHSARGLIHGGSGSNQCHWPSAAPMFYNSLRYPNWGFFCGSNIISKDFVVTAAHCLWEKRNRFPLREDKFYVYAGRNSLNLSVVEEGSLMLTPSSIFIHQDWDPNSESFDGDIALIKLNQSLKFSDRIKPIALPPRVQISDGKGFIFGWGKSKDHEVEIFPKLAETRSISAQLCRWQQSNILEAISDRSFCVGGPDKRTPCKGDSGGGFYKENNGEKVLYGIVSSGGPICGDDSYAVMTDVTQFVGWIETFLNRETHVEELKWKANIFFGRDEFVCSGSVIYFNKVLTAASCIQGKGEPQPPPKEHFRVEIEGRSFKVTSIIIHPDWDFTMMNIHKGNLAIIELDDDVQDSSYIINLSCEYSSSLKFIAYNFREYQSVPIATKELSYAECVRNNRTMNAYLDAESMTCAHQEEFDFCSVGKGEAVYTGSAENQLMTGLVSIGFRNFKECHENRTLVVTNIEKYVNWIRVNSCNRCAVGCKFTCEHNEDCRVQPSEFQMPFQSGTYYYQESLFCEKDRCVLKDDVLAMGMTKHVLSAVAKNSFNGRGLSSLPLELMSGNRFNFG